MRILDKEGKAGSLEDFEFVIRLNLIGSFNALRLGAERMAQLEPIDGERGVVVMTASAAAYEVRSARSTTRRPRRASSA